MNNKEILIRDLCMRIPYGLKIHIDIDDRVKLRGWEVQTLIGVDDKVNFVIAEHNCYKLEKIKPYLRSMSSMTKKEKREYKATMDVRRADYCAPEYIESIKSYDWLIEHHFDFRNLIEQGLALKAPEGMYDNI